MCWLCIVDVIQAVQYHIKPLSQHSRIGQPTEDDLKRPLNELKLNGNFSLGEMHSWVSLCLPEIPERTTTDEITYYFKSAFLGTVLFCTYKYVISSGSYCYTFCVDIVYQIMLIYFCLCYVAGNHYVISSSDVWFENRKGEAIFKSDNISTLAQVKEVATKEATRRNITVTIHFGMCVCEMTYFRVAN